MIWHLPAKVEEFPASRAGSAPGLRDMVTLPTSWRHNMIRIFVLVAAVALATTAAQTLVPQAGTSAATPSGLPASASGVMIGIDVDPSQNAANELGPIETCAEVAVGQQFDVDIWIKNVAGMHAWELNLTSDGSRVEVVTELFMLISSFAVSDGQGGHLPHNGGSYFAGAGSLAPVSAQGGVLIRITLRATSAGVMSLGIVNPHLNFGTDPIAIGGGVFGASVAIGESCTATVTPVPTVPPTSMPITPTPSPTPSPSPVPTMTPAATATSVPTQTLPPTAAPTPLAYDGPSDPDCNGVEDLDDVIRLLEGFIGVAPAISGCPGAGTPVTGYIFADVNCDGQVNGVDVTTILRRLSGLSAASAC